MKIRFAFLLMVVGLIATVSSCTQRSLNALNPCTINGVVQNVPVNPQRALDLLIVIDDSPSMRDEQAKLAEQVPRLVNLLLTGGEDTDGSTPVGEFPAIESLHVGIITPDLGYSTVSPHATTSQQASTSIPTMACTSVGKAGFMQVEGLTGSGTDRVACMAQTPPAGTLYLNYPEPGFDRGGSDQRRHVRDGAGRRLRFRAAAREHSRFGPDAQSRRTVVSTATAHCWRSF